MTYHKPHYCSFFSPYIHLWWGAAEISPFHISACWDIKLQHFINITSVLVLVQVLHFLRQQSALNKNTHRLHQTLHCCFSLENHLGSILPLHSSGSHLPSSPPKSALPRDFWPVSKSSAEAPAAVVVSKRVNAHAQTHTGTHTHAHTHKGVFVRITAC